ncbi:MAG: hypothetical protein HQL95_09370 [Magnetococcales bacterium]|nr:hypothetical protein [Magnetococcales bacterium]
MELSCISVGGLAGALLTIFINHYYFREKNRKEDRINEQKKRGESIAQTIALANQLEALGITYWISSELDSEKRAITAFRIKSLSNQLGEKLSPYQDVGERSARELTNFRRSITGDAFDMRSFVSNPSRAKLINDAATKFRKIIELCR